MRDFRHLDVWHIAHAFTLSVYRITETFPKAETYGLAAALRGGSAQLTMKIAEGCGKDHEREYGSCLQQARGMGMEVEYQLLLAKDLQFMKEDVYGRSQAHIVEVRKMLSGLIRSVAV